MGTSAAAVSGAQARAAIKTGDAGDVDWSSGTVYSFPFLSESIVKQEQVINDNGIRGTRTKSKEQDRAGTYTVAGGLNLVASPILLSNWLPSILGTAKSAGGGGGELDRYTTGETLVEFGLLIDKVGKIFEYQDCQVGSAVITGTKDQVVEMQLQIQSLEQAVEASWDSNISSIAVLANSNPYIFHDLTLTVDGEAGTPVNEFTITIDNMLDVAHRNSQKPTSITPQDRTVSLALTVPFNSTNYTGLYAGADTSAQLILSDGSFLCYFEFAHLALERQTPVVSGKTDVGLELNYTAKASNYSSSTPSTHELYVNLDITI